MLMKKISVGAMGVNCYIVGAKNESIIIDPGDDADAICSYVEAEGLTVKYILLTHCHFDHILAAQDVKKKTNGLIVACLAEKNNLNNSSINMTGRFTRTPLTLEADIYVSEGDTLTSEEYTFAVLETPGHSSGSMCIYCASEKILFSGDTLFRCSIGRSDFPTGDYNSLISSIKTKLYTLPKSTRVYPGHETETTIEYEITHNPFTA